MMQPDWDAIAADADVSPRITWAELEPYLDEMQAIVVVYLDKDNIQYMHHSLMPGWQLIGMLELAKWLTLHEAASESDE